MTLTFRVSRESRLWTPLLPKCPPIESPRSLFRLRSQFRFWTSQRLILPDWLSMKLLWLWLCISRLHLEMAEEYGYRIDCRGRGDRSRIVDLVEIFENEYCLDSMLSRREKCLWIGCDNRFVANELEPAGACATFANHHQSESIWIRFSLLIEIKGF